MVHSFEAILERIRTIEINEKFDLIVAIANGGILPAALINQRLDCEFRLLKINLRDAMQRPRHASPVLMSAIDFDFMGKSILLVDDRVKSGATLTFAKQLLEGAAVIKVLAVNGKADYSLFDEDCFKFPWII